MSAAPTTAIFLSRMLRTIQPELLDSLPPQHPAALHNRRDLRLINAVMGNHRWIARTLPSLVRRRERILELGAGTGELALKLAQRQLPVDGLDLWPRPPELPAAHRWHVADLRAFSHYADYPVVIGNLIFHQFNETELQSVGHAWRDTARVIVACEPVRRRSSQLLFRVIAPLLGANHVTLHDAHVSIAAGFRGDELPLALGLDLRDWDWTCSTTPLGAYRLVATRRS